MKKQLVWVMFLWCIGLQAAQVPLYFISTPSHEILKNEWFLPSVLKCNEFELHEFSHKQTCQSGKFMEAGWKGTTLAKVDMIIQAIKENWGGIFVYSDVDIYFYQPMTEFLLEFIEDHDFIIQQDSPHGGMCTGFFMCRANEKMLRIWQEAKKIMQTTARSDQPAFNTAFSRLGKKLKVRGAKLPINFYGGGAIVGKHWHPGMALPVPENIYLHHANWTVGVSNKIAQLKYVQAVVAKRNK